MLNIYSIKFRVIAASVVILVTGIALSLVFVLPFVQEQVRTLVAAQQLSIASYVARDIDHSMVERKALIAELAATFPSSLLMKPEEMTAWLKSRQRLNPAFNGGILVIPPGGSGTLAEYPIVSRRNALDFSASPWFQQAISATTPVVSRAQRGRISGVPIVILAVAVRDAEGRVAAVLAGLSELNSGGFLDRLQENKLGKTGGFLLISPADKMFVGASDPSMILKPTPATGVNLLHDRAMAGFRGTGITINARGIEELSAIASVPSVGWFVVARIPTAEVFQPIEILHGFVWKSGLIALAVILAILLFLLPRILRPLTGAAQAMRAMADGKHELTPLPVRHEDEVGSLVLGFNYLVERLREKEAALKASNERMAFLAHHDSLTGLCNRVLLEDRLQQSIARAERSGRPFALLFCDLDRFKPVNDEYGHDVGDALLVQVARRLSDGRRKSDTVARLGGDEFVILVNDLEDAQADAERLAQQYVAAISAPYLDLVDGHALTITVSIGIALYRGVSVPASKLLSQADIAMYQAKRSDNQICFFHEEALKASANENSTPATSI